MAKDTDLVWVELNVASLPAELQKALTEAREHNKKAKELKEKARKALEKRWIDAKRMPATEEVVIAFSRFGDDKVNVARKERKTPKATAKPTVAW
jgi:hypothetical protein